VVKFDTIIGQDQPLRILNTLIEKNSIPHALLFTGLKGVGKLATANAFALTCNCTRQNTAKSTDISKTKHPPSEKLSPDDLPSCRNCSSCKKILSGNHPDILYVKPAARIIKIAQIRDLIDTLSMKPYEARLRVVVISEAQLMNPSAGNALLKILEEPPDRTILILTTTQRGDVLPTIGSRCQIIRFMPLSRKRIASELNNTHGVPHQSAKVLSYMADGSLIRAIELHKKRWLQHRNWLLSETGFDKLDMIDILPTNVLLAVVEKMLARKAQVAISLETMLIWLRDIIVCRYEPDRVINADLIDKLKKVSQKIPETTILKKMDVIRTAQKDIEANANLRLVMEMMMLKLRRADS
jgi:DNA polymerase-3 subunit delta'